MEISRDLINDNSTFNKTTFIIIHGFDGVSVNLLGALTSVREVSMIIHNIVNANIVSIPIYSMFVEPSCHIYDMNSGHIDHI